MGRGEADRAFRRCWSRYRLNGRRSGVGTTRVTFSERGMKESKVEDTGFTHHGQRWLAKFGHGYKWSTLPERGTFGVDQE
jgi:hypothetical protein